MIDNKGFKKFDFQVRGITLVALVVTIVVLIILATISINIIFGEEGILNRAQQGKQEMANAQEEEKEILANAANSVDGYIVGERENSSNGNITKEVLFSGKADTAKTEYQLSDSIENYSFIIVYSSLSEEGINNVSSIIIDTSDIVYGTSYGRYSVGMAYSSSYIYDIRFNFSAKDKLYIYDKSVIGWTYSGVHYEIYRIVGIK